jgi:hypothetical protein
MECSRKENLSSEENIGDPAVRVSSLDLITKVDALIPL